MANRIQLRRDTAANWTRVNPVLEDGEPGLEIDTNKVKYGDGNTRWNALSYASDSTSNTHIEYTDDTTGYTSTVDLTYDFNVDTDNSHLDINGGGSWSIGSNNFDTKIYSTADGSGDPTKIVVRANDNDWIFGNTGSLTLPYGGLINYANGTSILSGITADGTTYSNANVASYLVANPQAGTYSNANVTAYLVANPEAGTYSDANVASYLVTNPQAGTYSDANVASYLVTNPQAGTYSNANVASYLTSGNLESAWVHGNLTVGNLVVNGNSSIINTESYVVEDNIIQMANANPADVLDLGFVAHRTVGSTLEHTGLVRDASINKWALFSNVIAQPGTTVDLTNAVLDDLLVGTVQGTDFKFANGVSILSTITVPETYSNTNVAAYLSSSTLKTVANLAVSGSAPSSLLGSTGDTAGMIRADSNYVYYCTSTFVPSSWTVGWEGSTGNTLFLTKGDYPTPQVGWTVTYAEYGPYTIQTVADESNWRITFDGALGSPGGGTATLTNPNPSAIWKSVPLNTFQTAVTGTYSNANVASYLTNGVSGNVKTTANVIGTTFMFANGVNILSTVGAGSTYSNANVASYLPTYSGNIGAGNIVTTGATSGNISGANYISANVFQVSTGIFWANGVAWSSTSGSGTTYTNANVSAFLSAFGSNTISTTGNITAGNVVTTGTYTVASIQTTGTYGNITGANVISANTVTVTTTVRTVPVTFANLPTAASAGAGARAFITDGNTTTFASAVSGSGANSVPVYSNGTAWFVG